MDAVTSYLTDKILKDIDNLQSTEKKKMPQLYNATPGFQNKTKADLIAGKTNLGAVALGNSHHMLAQSVNLTQKVLKEVAKLNISNLSGIYSQQPNYHDKQTIITLISDWISAMVNAHVDVAKDPYINRLNVRKFTINTTNFLLRAGKGESTFYFLSQKILRDAADKFEAYSGSYGVEDTKFGASSEAKIRVREEYSKKAKELLGIDDTELKERIKDVYLNENPFNIDYLRSILPTKDTGEWYVSQLAILDVYDKIEPYARALSELTKLSQIDTKKYGNNFALQQNFLIKMAEFNLNNKTFPDPLSVIKNTFLRDKLINGLIRPRKYLGNIFVRTTEAFENKRREIYKILGKDNATMSDEFINNVTRMMEASYKTDFWINYAKNNGIKVGSLLTGDNSIPKRLYKIKQKILQNPGLNLTNSDGKFSNALLDNINMMIKTDAQMMALPDFIQFKQNKSDDHNLDDHIIRAWEELLDLTVSDSGLEPVAKEIREFARDLAVYSFFTSGDAFGRNNIFKYVPNSFRESSGYYDYIRQVEENPSEYISKIRISEILKNLWWSDEVVPSVNVFKQTFEESEYGFSKVLSIDDNVATNILPSNKNIKVNGRDVNVPSSFTLNPFKFNKLLIGKNDRDQLVYTPFVKINIGPANNPLSTEIYRFYGIRLIPSKSGSIEAPVYVLDSKKGLKFRGCFLAEPAPEYSSLVKTNKNLKYAIKDSNVTKNVSFTLYSNDPYNNMGEIEYLEKVLNSTTNKPSSANTSDAKSFDDFVKEAGDAFDEATVNKVKEDLSKQTTSRNTQPSFTFKDGTTVTTDFELNDQQKFALLELEKFFNSEETVFSLQGYAGTGKTTIMKIFDKYLNNRFFKPLYVSPTHKANAVTRANNPEALVKTIHSLLGLSPDYDVLKDSFDLSKIKFSSPSGINNTVQGTLIIVDESSMLEDSLADHLVEEAKKNGNRIIFIGDPAQLSPVGQTTESKALNYSGKVELTKVERTGDNAILKDATSLRENNTLSYITDLNDKGDGIIYTNKPATLDFFLKNVVNKNDFKNPLELRILTGENKHIPTFNKIIRNLLFGENAPQLVKGDILMGYSNEKRTRDPRKPYEIINSGDYIVDEISDLTEKVVPYTDNKIKVFGYKVSLKNAYDNSNVETFILDSNNNANSIAATQLANLVNDLWSVRGKLLSEGRRKEASKIIDIINSINNSFSTMFDVKDQYGKIIRYKTFDYAYTQTVHKSQGATYNNVVVLEDTFNNFSESEKQKLKYVALTRAKHKVLYYTSAKVNNRDITDVTSSKIKEMQNNAKRLSELGEERRNECE